MIQNLSRAAIVLIVLAIVIVVFAGCGDGKGSTSIEDQNTGPAAVMEYPRGFRNVAHKCDGHGHRVYSASRGNDAEANVSGAVAVIDDPSCPGGSGQ